MTIRRRVTGEVRKALWRMRSSDDMAGLLATIRQGLIDLDIPLLYCGVNVVETFPDPPEVTSHSMNPQGEWHRLQSVGAATVYDFWKQGEIVYRRDLHHDDPYGESKIFPDVACIIDVPFAQGTLAASSREPHAFSEEHVELLQEMADLLEDGFRRLAQLRAMEVRGNLREQVWKMRGTTDIEQVMAVVRQSLKSLGIRHINCGINLIDGDQFRSHNIEGGDWQALDVGPQPLIERIWRGGKPVYRRDLEKEDEFNERDTIRGFYGESPRSVVDIPFSHGTLALNSDEPNAFSEDQVDWLVYLAEGLEEGFRRVDDLRVLEEHNRDLEREIAERKRAETDLESSLAEKDVLLKEVHHRVKNNLQVVSSLLSLRANSIQDEAAQQSFADSRSQIEAMAFIHECLYESPDLGHIDCGEYIGTLAENVLSSYGTDRQRINLRIDVTHQVVDVDTGIHCGLLVHELLSNCLKYAFPEGRSGTIGVELSSLSTGMVTLRVYDDGVGIPLELDAIHSAQTLGLRLVADLTKQLHGTLSLDRVGGTSLSISFPVTA
ncbi:MAG: hypothetical protein HOG99_19440 [Gemmatimonadetes bacterium]|nr:hypothetical protein [Gemmatimonadota bacterium]MBT5963729.1 hypothetical protein [Gemmatimonadota bacterium]